MTTATTSHRTPPSRRIWTPPRTRLWAPHRRRTGWRPKRPVLNGRPPDCNCNCETVTSSSASASSSTATSPQPIGVNCCPNDIPQTVTCTIVGVSGTSNCGCMVGLSIPLVYNSTTEQWEGVFESICGDGEDRHMLWKCEDPPLVKFTLSGQDASAGSTCDPLYFPYSFSDNDDVCGQPRNSMSYQVEITE